MRRVHVLVAGRVQGVGYRYSAAQVAAGHGVGGWIRNRSDGSVEAEVAGDHTAVEAVLTWMRQGPPGAWVTGVEENELDPVADEEEFTVLS